ncbi:MAG: formylglycine-generating enzyme family protein [Desulfobacula sp.]|uniref:formylglycine-generating enzyme family protein n=1 Tax=Desulfobacula sp. TaxID=2593537 RepID=UPI001E0F7024|nr:formylglycine-generating enzyme family protein [Desulfobacula sp.]MBT3485137.1 formylglycine-generating enzyme family protein [Desulfobacula sp.]MBT3804118.1 formylglycine-generating enzyme family protein [Desulfobacula sp.]MBT4025341.1 formylglycine-generating enzyme family protein [Desulfobacula sp.]MBT4506356.1 formylglycine-generating enzyme family protein [Desulfobacula sp.]
MKKKLFVGLAAGLFILGMFGLAGANSIVINDHFDDNTLDPSWSTSFEKATGWSYTESGTSLKVTDMITTAPGWASVNLTQYITPLSDFNISFKFSWDSENNVKAVQNVIIQAYAQDGTKIAEAGFSDGWINSEGAGYGMIEGNQYDTGPDSLSSSGSAVVTIARKGNDIKILWDGAILIEGTSSDLLYRVDLVFSHNLMADSFFGNEAIDAVKVEGSYTPVSEPSTNSTSISQIYTIAPASNETLSFGSANGQLAFAFSKITDATKYLLTLQMNDLINSTMAPISIELVPEVSGTLFLPPTAATPGFSETFLGMTYNLPLDKATWDSMALYKIKWGIEAYNSSDVLIGSTYKSLVPDKYACSFKLLSSTAIAMTSPAPGSELNLSDSPPVFKWDLYSGVAEYELILARVDGASFSPVIPFSNLTFNLLTMDAATWQSMPAGTWYWTVLGSDPMGNKMPSKFTMFDFEVSGTPVTTPTNPSTSSNSLGMDFVYIAPGAFMMGSTLDKPGMNGDETLHQETLTKGYYMQTTEVSQSQWEALMGSNPSFFKCSDCPVEQVSWNDAQVFIQKLNQKGEGTYMLPTEAQWEYAARAGSTSSFANGAITATGSGYDPNLDAMGWYTYNSNSMTNPVAQKMPNAWGLYDMHGNVLEWCQDWYGSYNSGSVTDSVGPSSGSTRVIRGGSWVNDSEGCPSAVRYYGNPEGSINLLGFRLALALDKQ